MSYFDSIDAALYHSSNGAMRQRSQPIVMSEWTAKRAAQVQSTKALQELALTPAIGDGASSPRAPNQSASVAGIAPVALTPSVLVASNDQAVATDPGLLTCDAAFPVPDMAAFDEFAPAVVAESLAALCQRVRTASDYRTVRGEYCRLSVLLNLKGAIAPAFRPVPVIRGANGHPVPMGDSAHKLMLRDRLVIDYHWCAARMDIHPSEAQHVALFAPGRDFSFADAWVLACKKHRGRYRAAEAMMLTTLQQCQTLTLRGPELSERVTKLSSDYRDSGGKFASRNATAKRKIREWTERMPRMKAERHVYEHLWDARELLGKENVTLVGELLALMLGQPKLDRKTIKGKLEKLDKQVQL